MVSEYDYMKSQRRLAVGSLLIGILIGAVAGGVTALLVAPNSGQKTRQMIKEKTKEGQHVLQERLSNIKAKVGQVKETIHSRARQEMDSVNTEK